MAPLFQAMHHGCQAGRHQEALQEVSRARIDRGQEFYATRNLGAFGADLAALAGLFDPPWDKPVATLTKTAQAFILNQAAFRLRALGRLREAVAPMRAGLERYVSQENWKGAAQSRQQCLPAASDARRCRRGAGNGPGVRRACRPKRRRLSSASQRTALADALHQAGEAARAQVLFEEAEALQTESQPDYPWLYSFGGYCCCDLLLALGRAAEVRERAAQLLQWAGGRLAARHRPGSPLPGPGGVGPGRSGEARTQLDQAVDGLRKAGTMDHLPRGLLARAALFRETSDFPAARRDLQEVMRIARRGEMRLFQCDAHLEFARLALAEGNREKAREHVAEARRLVDETGYGRRRPEVEALEAEVGVLG